MHRWCYKAKTKQIRRATIRHIWAEQHCHQFDSKLWLSKSSVSWFRTLSYLKTESEQQRTSMQSCVGVFVCEPDPGEVTRDDVFYRSVFALIDVPAVFHLLPLQLLDQVLLLPLVLVGGRLRKQEDTINSGFSQSLNRPPSCVPVRVNRIKTAPELMWRGSAGSRLEEPDRNAPSRRLVFY